MNCLSSGVNKVLIVDDDRRMHEGIRDYLEPIGFHVRSLYEGAGAGREITDWSPDIILLDVMLPGGQDGFALLQNIRKVSAVPVIMMTARGEETDRIVGLEMGADDYLPKPLSLRELHARIKAVLRRCTPDGKSFSDAAVPEEGKVRSGSFLLDTKRHILYRNNKELLLSTSEVGILKAFLEHPGEALSRDRILSLAFGDECCTGDRNTDVHVSRIRSRLHGLDASLNPIRTVWGLGYRWVEDE